MVSLLTKIDHRPFPLPDSPWVMTQTWSKLLFAHWPIEPNVLREFIPKSLELDLFDGDAWLGVVPFRMNDVHPRYTTNVPWVSNFLELNVRTYVKKEEISGVYFFSLDCSNPLAVWGARAFYHLPYFFANMNLADENGLITYASERLNKRAAFFASYKPTGDLINANKGSLDKFLTERYCLYTTNSKNKLFRGVIHHEVWPLQPAEAEIRINSVTTAELGIDLPECAPILHYSERLVTVEWPLAPVE